MHLTYRIEDFFPYKSRSTRFHYRSHVVLTFQWSKDSPTLSISPTSSFSEVDKANATVLQVLDAPVGDTDGVSLPYFAEADAVIMFWLSRDLGFQDHREYGQFALTMQVVDTPHQNRTIFSVLAADDHTLTPFHTPPLITIGYDPAEHHLVSVQFPSAPRSCLAPSYTIKLRTLLMHLIAPVAVVGYTLVLFAVLLLKVLLGLVGVFVVGHTFRLFRPFQGQEVDRGEDADSLVAGRKQRTLDEEAAVGTKVDVSQ